MDNACSAYPGNLQTRVDNTISNHTPCNEGQTGPHAFTFSEVEVGKGIVFIILALYPKGLKSQSPIFPELGVNKEKIVHWPPTNHRTATLKPYSLLV